MALAAKEADCISGEPFNLHLNIFEVNYFPLLLWIIAENRTKLKHYLIWTLQTEAERNIRQLQTALDFLISICSNASDILKQPPEVFYKKGIFLEILQNVQKKPCSRAFF